MTAASERSDEGFELGNLTTSNHRIRALSILRLKMRIHDHN